MVDAAQSICHRRIDVQKIDCDWLVFSGHKLGGPFGIGVLYSKEPLPAGCIWWWNGTKCI